MVHLKNFKWNIPEIKPKNENDPEKKSEINLKIEGYQ